MPAEELLSLSFYTALHNSGPAVEYCAMCHLVSNNSKEWPLSWLFALLGFSLCILCIAGLLVADRYTSA